MADKSFEEEQQEIDDAPGPGADKVGEPTPETSEGEPQSERAEK